VSEHVVDPDAAAAAIPAADAVGQSKAFISYNRGASSHLAQIVRRALRRIAVPWYRRSRFAVFLDRSSLAANPNAWETVARALDETQKLVLLASPAAARSKWVEREVAHWRTRHPSLALAVALTEGTLSWDEATRTFESEALPPAAQTAFTDEPLWVDLTWARRAPRWKLTLWNPLFRDNVASLAAYVRSVDKEIIVDEDGRQRRRGLVGVLVVAAGVVALALALVNALSGKSFEQRVAASRQLARDSAAAAADRRTDLALLLAVHAVQTSGTAEARSALLDALSGTDHLRRLLHASGEVASVAIDSDGRTVALGLDDGRVEVWNAASGQRTAALPSAGRGLARVALGADRVVVAGWADGTVASSDARSVHWRPLLRANAAVEALVASRDGRKIAIGLHDGRVVLLDPLTADELTRFRVARTAVRTLAFDPAATTLGVGTQRGDLLLRRIAGGPLRRGADEPASVVSLAFDPGGQRLAFGRDDGVAGVWKLHGNRFVRVHPRGHDAVTGIGFGTNVGTLVTAGAGGDLRVWDLHGSRPSVPRTIAATASVAAFAVAPGGNAAVSGGGAQAQVWSFRAPKPLTQPLARLRGSARAVAFDSRLRMLAASAPGEPIRLFDLHAHEVAATLSGAQHDVVGLAFADGGDTLVSVGSDRSVVRWRLDDRPPTAHEVTPPADVVAAALGAGGSPLAYVDSTGAVRLGSPPGRVVAHVDPIAPSLAVDARGRTVAVGDDTTIRVWPHLAGAGVFEFPDTVDGRPPDLVSSVAFRADGAVLAAGNTDHELALWDLEHPARPFAHAAFGGAVTALAFSADGSELAVGTADGRFTSWSAEPTAWESLACRIANRNLTERERRVYLQSAASRRGCREPF
jgi:WD40 repeat protein